MFYKKGDMVRINEDLHIGNFYGPTPIKLSYDMAADRGKIGPITDINEAEQAVKVGDWWWSIAMVTLVASCIPAKYWIPTDDCVPDADPKCTKYMVICTNKKGVRSLNLAWIDESRTWHGMGTFAKVTHWAPKIQLPEVEA